MEKLKPKRKPAKKPAKKKKAKLKKGPKTADINEIRITKATNGRQMRISTSNPFFRNRVIAEWKDNNKVLVFHLAAFDNVKALKAVETNYTFVLAITGECEPGNYIVDAEDSNEDQKVIYLSE